MNECCWSNLKEANNTARATWVCPVCGEDVSLHYYMLMEAESDKYRLLVLALEDDE